ncbi:MAG: sigma-54-dependent transcriptional regulator [Nitrospinota bacterium]
MNQGILIVDDEQEMRLALSEALTSFGFSVQTAENGLQGLQIIKNSQISLVITDVRMPGMDGVEMLREIRRGDCDIPVIVITAYGAVENAVEAMKFGAADYILKPFSADTLEEAVATVLRKSSPRSKPSFSQSEKKKTVTDSVFSDGQMQRLMEIVEDISLSSSTVLIQGESGTGKEVIARLIHEKSERSGGPFVGVNCSALPKDLLESELFGHEKGAFTGALSRKIGKFEQADGGTILLDEISEMAPPLQAKLLRVLQEHEVDRVGGTRPVPIDTRVIATTNRNLNEWIKKGEFREDLFYRLNVIPLTIPALRERKGDIRLLAEHFLKKYSSLSAKKISRISNEAMEILLSMSWKGNVRELENVIERGVIFCKGEELGLRDLMLDASCQSKEEQSGQESGQTVWAVEKNLILSTLDQVNNNRTQASDLLGISIRTLRNKLNEYKEKGLL